VYKFWEKIICISIFQAAKIIAKTPEFISNSDDDSDVEQAAIKKTSNEEPITSSKISKLFKCLSCKYVTKEASNLRRHSITCDRKKSSGTLMCPEKNCGSLFSTLDNMDDHLETSHGRKMRVDKLFFKTEEEMKNWMHRLAVDEYSKYIRNGHRLGKSQIFYCHRSSQFKKVSTATGKRNAKKSGTIKSEKICTSRIKSERNPDGIRVTFIQTHSGHTACPGRIGFLRTMKTSASNVVNLQAVKSEFLKACELATDSVSLEILSNGIRNSIALIQGKMNN